MSEFQSACPNVSEIDPTEIPFQADVVFRIRNEFDYKMGCHQVFLSGAVGSAKSLLMAHIVVTHALMYPTSNIGIGRLSKPSLKTTLIDKILKHMRGYEDLYKYHKSTGNFEFTNGSKITAYSWADTNWDKVRSEEFSLFAIEELSENNEKEFYFEILMRMNRRPDIPENVLISATNPDEPDHWIYKNIIEVSQKQYAKDPDKATVHVVYSKTHDNPYLPKSYVNQLMDQLDPLMVQRMIFGQWISIRGDKIYYAYDPDVNRLFKTYEIDKSRPIGITFDFNIGVGKPMSCCLFQYYEKENTATFHVFDECIIEGADTEQLLNEIADRGLFDYNVKYEVFGDASGKSRHSASKKSDYDIIQDFMDNYRINNDRLKKIKWIKEVPLSNPPIRTRHNKINALCRNGKNKVNLHLYKKCKTLHDGLRLCKLLKGAKYQEDDSKPYQHVTTALGYGVVRILKRFELGQTETIQL